jgi:hypothetical protein
MATTTNYSWTTPDDTALVKDGAAAIRTLGSSIDTTTKNLNPSTTLGDIEYRSSTANTNTRLGIGTTGQVLAVTGGVPAWTTLAGGANPTILSNTTGRYITPVGAITDDVIEVIEDRTYYIPIFLTGLSFDRISIRTSSTYSGTSSVRLGLFNCNLTTGKPSTVAFDAGTVSTNAANTTFEITISQTPVSGYYFFAFNAQTISANPKFSGINVANNFQKMLINSRGALSNGSNSTSGYIEDGVTGAFATASGVAEITGDLPIIGLRTA